ncbi:MAG: acetylesterase [Herbinix sp.]|jgi:acetyl esterase/lipase|nr:acetylesterase [Herbinix sp.]
MVYKTIEIEANQQAAILTTYILDNSREMDVERTRPMVIICPGGGYRFLSDREAEPIAVQMNAMGFHACVLRYSVYPAKFPTALVQLAKSVALCREHAKEWNINADKIIVAGFSAGGHLAASLGTLWQEKFLEDLLQMPKANYQPNGMLLSYPVISSGPFAHSDSYHALLQEEYEGLLLQVSLEKQVNTLTPPAFVWHTANDDVVPVENSFLFTSALNEHKIPFELHIYPKGAHGLALANEETMNMEYDFGVQKECQNWITMAETWINNL